MLRGWTGLRYLVLLTEATASLSDPLLCPVIFLIEFGFFEFGMGKRNAQVHTRMNNIEPIV